MANVSVSQLPDGTGLNIKRHSIGADDKIHSEALKIVAVPYEWDEQWAGVRLVIETEGSGDDLVCALEVDKETGKISLRTYGPNDDEPLLVTDWKGELHDQD